MEKENGRLRVTERLKTAYCIRALVNVANKYCSMLQKNAPFVDSFYA